MLSRLLLRARINGLISWTCIEDTARPVSLGGGFLNPDHFIESELDSFLAGYGRKLLQSQPNRIEIVAEKLTVRSILETVSWKYTMPLTISRGFSSGTVKQDLFTRFKMSRKPKLILLLLSDLDPTGDTIAEDMVNYMRRDCGMKRDTLEAYKVALTRQQVKEFKLPPIMQAKATDPTRKKFVAKHKTADVYELEALEPADLAKLLERAITQVIDMKLYEQELKNEAADRVPSTKSGKSSSASFGKR